MCILWIPLRRGARLLSCAIEKSHMPLADFPLALDSPRADTAQWCVLTISVPLGVGQAPVDNSRGSYKIKNVAQKKLVSFGTFRLIPYIQKIWILSTMNLPVQDLIRQKWFFGRCKNWRFQFQKWKVTCWLNLQFSTFCTFFNWFRKSCNQIFKIWF